MLRTMFSFDEYFFKKKGKIIQKNNIIGNKKVDPYPQAKRQWMK